MGTHQVQKQKNAWGLYDMAPPSSEKRYVASGQSEKSMFVFKPTGVGAAIAFTRPNQGEVR